MAKVKVQLKNRPEGELTEVGADELPGLQSQGFYDPDHQPKQATAPKGGPAKPEGT